MHYWLMKTEPTTFGIDDLAKRPQKTEPWDGVRNYQARNWLRSGMQRDDLAFFYHSNCAVPGIVGIVRIVRAGYRDQTQFNPDSRYFDPKSSIEKPRWFCVDVQLVERFDALITLAQLRAHPALSELLLLQRGSRLSVMPVGATEWQHILALRAENN